MRSPGDTNLDDWIEAERNKLDMKAEIMADDVKLGVTRQRIRNTNQRIVWIVIGLIALYISSNMWTLYAKYVPQAVWFEQSELEFGYKMGSVPEGTFDFKVFDVMLTADFPALAWLRSLTLQQSFLLPRSGAQFLLMALEAFGAKQFRGQYVLYGIHWAGSATQLRLADLPRFLDSNIRNDADALYALWAQKDSSGRYLNPWAPLFGALGAINGTALLMQPAIREYREASVKQGTVLHDLFSGGLCRVAMHHATKDVTARQLFAKAFSLDTLPPMNTQCEAERLQSGMDAFIAFAGLASVAIPPSRMLLAATAAAAGAGAYVYSAHQCTY